MFGFVCFVLLFSLAECYWHCFTVKHQRFSTAAVVLHYARAVLISSTVAAVLHYAHLVSTINSSGGSK